jgi:isocitrate/isopropylmalate dehydrogenase
MSPSTIRTKARVFKIVTIPGDGIGVDITEAAVAVLQKLAAVDGTFKFEFTEKDWSSKMYQERGYYMPEDGLEQLKNFDAIYFGAVGWPGRFKVQV